MKTTGEKIRESRTHLGLTQTELADKIVSRCARLQNTKNKV